MEKIERKNYSKIPDLLDIPNLLDVQLESYRNFILSADKDKPGENLKSVFETVFPIVSARENFVLGNIHQPSRLLTIIDRARDEARRELGRSQLT